MRLIDLSVTLDNNRHWAPWWARDRVTRQGHRFGSFAIWLLFQLRPSSLRSGAGWANEEIKLSTHGTTHLDAPWHYAPTSEGRPARTVDQVPLDWCYGDGVVLDREFCILERLTGLEKLPPHGFKICCFPLKVKDGSAGPARVVAMLEG